MPAASSDPRKKELLALLARAQAIAQSMTTAAADEDASQAERLQAEAQRMQQYSTAFTLACIANEPAPISLFKPWASYSRFRQWEQAGKLPLRRINRKVCCTPSAFFAHWRSL